MTEGERAISKFFKEAVGQYLEPSPIPLKDQQPTRIVDEAIEWIDSQKDNPFFVWISFPEPHNPYQVCEPYYSMFAPDKIPAVKTSRKDVLKKEKSIRFWRNWKTLLVLILKETCLGYVEIIWG